MKQICNFDTYLLLIILLLLDRKDQFDACDLFNLQRRLFINALEQNDLLNKVHSKYTS